jgi:hypothetical protein
MLRGADRHAERERQRAQARAAWPAGSWLGRGGRALRPGEGARCAPEGGRLVLSERRRGAGAGTEWKRHSGEMCWLADRIGAPTQRTLGRASTPPKGPRQRPVAKTSREAASIPSLVAYQRARRRWKSKAGWNATETSDKRGRSIARAGSERAAEEGVRLPVKAARCPAWRALARRRA